MFVSNNPEFAGVYKGSQEFAAIYIAAAISACAQCIQYALSAPIVHRVQPVHAYTAHSFLQSRLSQRLAESQLMGVNGMDCRRLYKVFTGGKCFAGSQVFYVLTRA